MRPSPKVSPDLSTLLQRVSCIRLNLAAGVMMVIGVSSLVVSLMDIKPYFHLQLVPHMTKYHQVGVLLASAFGLEC